MLDDGLDIDLDLIPGDSLFHRLLYLIKQLNARGKVDDLVDRLRHRNNPRLSQGLAAICAADYLSLTGDAHDAMAFGPVCLVNRSVLRDLLRQFTTSSSLSPRVLVVRGGSPSGTSHSWYFIEHLARSAGHSTPIRIRLSEWKCSCPPHELMEAIRSRLDLPTDGWPEIGDDPQDSRASRRLTDWFVGKLNRLRTGYWLVLDDLNGPSASMATLDFVEGLAVKVQDSHPDNLWMALLGFPRDIPPPECYQLLQEEATPLARAEVRRHFEQVAAASNQPVDAEALDGLVEHVFGSAVPPFDREALQEIGRKIADTTLRLRKGVL